MITTLTLSIRALRCALSVLLLGAAFRVSAAPVSFDIPAQAAAEALDLFIKQSGANVVYLQADVQGVSTNAVQGTYEPAAALKLLLQGTVLTFTESKPGEFAVGRTKPGSIEGSVQSESGKPVAGARVSLTGTNQAVITDKRGRFTFDAVPAGLQAMAITAEGFQNTKVTDVNVKAGHRLTLSTIAIPVAVVGAVQLEDFVVSAKKDDGVVELDPYSVEGYRPPPYSTANIDLTRTENDVLPFQVYTAEDVSRSGVSDLAEFFRLRMPQNYINAITEQGETSGRLSTAQIPDNIFNLANGAGGSGSALGHNELVILVNGRRMPDRYIGNGGFTASPDIRGIAISSIERIELINSAASSLYGSGATAGVINIITKRGYRGGSLSIRYETPIDSDAAHFDTELTYGMPLTSTTKLRISVATSERDPLLAGRRASDTIDRWRSIVSQREPSRLTGTSTPPLGATPNIRSTSGLPLFGVGSPFYTSVPNGYLGGSGIEAFLSRQGIYNLELADGTAVSRVGKRSYLGAKAARSDGMIGIDQLFGESWIFTLEYARMRTKNQGYDSNQNSIATVLAGTPFNPFGTNVRVIWYDPRLDTPKSTNIARGANDQIIASLRGEVGDWRVLLDASYIRDKDDYKRVYVYAPLDPMGGFPDWGTAINAGRYNPFVDMRIAAPAPASFYDQYAEAVEIQGGTTHTWQATAKLAGTIAELAAGGIDVAGGIDWSSQKRVNGYARNTIRHSGNGEIIDEFIELSPEYPSPGVPKSRSVAAYCETTIPIFEGEFVRKIDAFTAGRISRQELDGHRTLTIKNVTVGKSTHREFTMDPAKYRTHPYTYAAGARIELPFGFKLRGSTSFGFKPPSFGNVVPGLSPTSSLNVVDRRKGQMIVLTPAMYRRGGNSDLEPENTQSTNIGFILEPKISYPLRLSLDYTDSRRSNAITSIDAQTILDLEDKDSTIAQRVTRNSSGDVTFVDTRTINFRQISSKTATLVAETRIRNVLGGNLVAFAAVTKNLSFKIQTSATSAATEQVRNPETTFGGTFVEWNGNAQVRWEARRFTAGWAMRYYDDILVGPSEFVAQGKDRIESDHEHDVFVSYRFGTDRMPWFGRISDGLTATLGVKNLTNRMPRFYASNPMGYLADSNYGRSIWFQVRIEL